MFENDQKIETKSGAGFEFKFVAGGGGPAAGFEFVGNSRICQLPLYRQATGCRHCRRSSSRRRVVFATRCAAAALGGEQSSASSSSAAARSAAAARTALQRGRGPDERQRCVP